MRRELDRSAIRMMANQTEAIGVSVCFLYIRVYSCVMPRKNRVEFEGAIYHVMDRGDRREAIFLDDKDRERFLETLGEACDKTGWRVHAYVLLGNHYHLMVQTPSANLVRGMSWLQSTYTVRFNRRHSMSGHLFQGRYKAVVVDGCD